MQKLGHFLFLHAWRRVRVCLSRYRRFLAFCFNCFDRPIYLFTFSIINQVIIECARSDWSRIIISSRELFDNIHFAFGGPEEEAVHGSPGGVVC